MDTINRSSDSEHLRDGANQLSLCPHKKLDNSEIITNQAVRVTRNVAQRLQNMIDEEASAKRRCSPRLRKPDDEQPCDVSSPKKSQEVPRNQGIAKKAKVVHSRKICCPYTKNQESTGEINGHINLTGEVPERNGEDVGGSMDAAVGKSIHAKVKETLRVFNTYYLQFVQEEENRCKKRDDEKLVKGSKAKEDVRVSKRPDLKAVTKMLETNAVLYPVKRFGNLPGIDVGHQFFSRAEMVVLGLHCHWLNGIDYMGQSYRKLEEYQGYVFPLAIAIVLSGQYEDDLDNSEDILYTGQGGNDLLGRKHQIKDQVLERGNLALKNNMEQLIPVRVIRGHDSPNSYTRRVYTYDGLYKVVQYWAEKGVSGFTVFKYRLRRVEGQLQLTTNQVHYARGRTSNKALSELPGLVSLDISQGQENISIPATNLFDDPPFAPTGFTYSSSVQVANNIVVPSVAQGCTCNGKCTNPKTCSCAQLNGSDFPYVAKDGGRLIEPQDVVFECGPNCGCGPGCVNRTSQRGLKYRFEVFRTPKKGWGVRSWDSIPSGAPVCEYTGVLRRSNDLDNVSENDYIFDIDCWQTIHGIEGRERRLRDVSLHPSNDHLKIDGKALDLAPEFCIDAGSVGNISRFINHSCEPNLFIQCVLSSHHDVRFARVMLFAADNIPPLQELTYDYGYVVGSVVGSDGKVKELACYCGAAGCRKRLY